MAASRSSARPRRCAEPAARRPAPHAAPRPLYRASCPLRAQALEHAETEHGHSGKREIDADGKSPCLWCSLPIVVRSEKGKNRFGNLRAHEAQHKKVEPEDEKGFVCPVCFTDHGKNVVALRACACCAELSDRACYWAACCTDGVPRVFNRPSEYAKHESVRVRRMPPPTPRHPALIAPRAAATGAHGHLRPPLRRVQRRLHHQECARAPHAADPPAPIMPRHPCRPRACRRRPARGALREHAQRVRGAGGGRVSCVESGQRGAGGTRVALGGGRFAPGARSAMALSGCELVVAPRFFVFYV